MIRWIPVLFVAAAAGFASQPAKSDKSKPATGDKAMSIGNFSVSLAVKDLKTSREFYEKLGFKAVAGNPAHNYQIMQNADCTIGLFQGMFEKNILTFNPGWNRNCETLPEFDDVRDIQKRLAAAGIELLTKADESSKGPASCVLQDPDGNQILIDQHVPKSGK